MPTDLTGAPTPLGIGTYNVDNDAPSGLGFNEAMGQIDTLIAARATLASPSFTGVPTAPTPTPGDISTKLATTSFVSNAITGFAPLASPTFTGTPAAPTPTTGDNSTRIATTAFVKAQGYLTANAVSTVFGRSGAVVAQSGDYTAAQVTSAADKASGSQQTFSGVVAAPAFLGTGPTTPTGVSNGGTYTPSSAVMGNWVSTFVFTGGGFTIANPSGVIGGSNTVGLMAITYTNQAGTSSAPTITWDTAYRFGGQPSQPGTVASNSSFTWLFFIDMPQSRVVCVGTTSGTFA